VRVVTVFTAGSTDGGSRFGDYGTRVAEDDRALAVLGCDADRLMLQDRIFRDPPLRGIRQLFRTPPDLAGFAALPAIEAHLRALLADPQVRLLAPLGIGNHVDHVEVAVAAMRAAVAADALDRIAFYEDYYALSERARRRHPVSRAAPRRRLVSRHGPSPMGAATVTALSMFARGPAPTDYADLDPARGDVRWQVAAIPVDTAAERRQLRAVAEYRSQLRVLGGRRGLAAMIRRAHARHSGELHWQLCRGAR